MEKRCPNCHQPLLPEDTACWQCGWQDMVSRAATTEAARSLPITASSFHVPADALYAAFTVFLVVLALILLHQLGRQPLVQVAAGGRLPPGWQRVTTHEQTLTLDLPPGWVWLDQEDPQQAAAYTALPTQRADLLGLTYPLGRLDTNASILFAAAPATEINLLRDPITLVVIRSPILSQLTAEQAIVHVQQADVDLVDARQAPNYDKTHTSFLLEMDTAAGGRVRCRQQLFLNEIDSLLLAVCGEPSQFRLYAQEVEQILPTVQRLRP